MRFEAIEPCPLPDDPLRAEAAIALRDSGEYGMVVDDRWRLLYYSDQARLTDAGGGPMAPTAIGEYLFGPEFVRVSTEARFGAFATPVALRANFLGYGGLMLADTPGGKPELRDLVDSSLRDLVDDLSPSTRSTVTFRTVGAGLNRTHDVTVRASRLRDENGMLRGALITWKPAVPMSIMAQMAFAQDPDHLDRMFAMSNASRRAGAVLFADLENSSALARRLTTGSYFALVRRLIRLTDQCIVDAGGLVGRHVGDGVVAFFPVDSVDSESTVARACITAARTIRAALPEVAERCDLVADDVVARFGLHWGSTLYMGAITTSARTEVTGLGDEANEAARIEACATGGRTLASKQLVERLDDAAASALAIEPARIVYTRLADIDTATDKARRDAPDIAVCQL